MARPKLGQSETERLHMKLTAAELEAIDEWRYENRVPSRSEAIRRLCVAGMAIAQTAPIEPAAKPIRGPFKATYKPLPVHSEANPRPDHTDTLIPRRKVRERYGISEMTMWRWENNPSVEFPSPITVNRRKFFRSEDLSAWEERRSGNDVG